MRERQILTHQNRKRPVSTTSFSPLHGPGHQSSRLAGFPSTHHDVQAGGCDIAERTGHTVLELVVSPADDEGDWVGGVRGEGCSLIVQHGLGVAVVRGDDLGVYEVEA